MEKATELLSHHQYWACGPGGDDWDESVALTRRKNGAFTLKVCGAGGQRSCSRPFRTARGFFLALDQAGYDLTWTELGPPTDEQVRTMLPTLLQFAPDLEGQVRELLVTGQRPSEDDDRGEPRPWRTVTEDDVVDAVHAGSRCAQSLVFHWFDQALPEGCDGGYEMTDQLSEVESGGIILWDEFGMYQDDVEGSEALVDVVSARRWAKINREDFDGTFTPKEQIEITRANMRRYLAEPVEGRGYQILVMADSQGREVFLPVMLYGSSMEGVDTALLGAYRTVDAAVAELKRHGIIDADDYRGPQQARSPLPRHEHSGRDVPWIGKAKPGASARVERPKRYLALEMLDEEGDEGVVVGVYSSVTRALGECMALQPRGGSTPTAVRLAAPGWRYHKGQTVKVGSFRCPF